MKYFWEESDILVGRRALRYPNTPSQITVMVGYIPDFAKERYYLIDLSDGMIVGFYDATSTPRGMTKVEIANKLNVGEYVPETIIHGEGT
jgi:hypothetical protein